MSKVKAWVQYLLSLLFLIVIIALIVYTSVGPIIDFFGQFRITYISGVCIDKPIENGFNAIQFRPDGVLATDGSEDWTILNRDSILNKKVNSRNVIAGIKIGNRYELKCCGYRVPLFSCSLNVLSSKPLNLLPSK